MTTIKWGILSTARHAENTWLPQAHKAPSGKVVAVASRDLNRAQQFAQENNIPHSFGSYEAMLADDNVDAVYIPLPNSMHKEWAIKTAQAGKHVMCEKPLAMTTTETSELVILAKETGLAAGVNYNLRFYPLIQQAKEMVASGEVGDVFSIIGSYTQDWLLYPTDYNWRVLAEEGGAVRAVGDIGTHWMDMMQTITGAKVTEVCADLKIVHPVRKRPKGEVETYSGKVDQVQAADDVPIDTEDCGTVMLRFDNGAKGCLWVSQTTAGRKNCLRYEIAGSKKALYWDSQSPNEMWLGYRNKSNERLDKDPGLASANVQNFIGYPGGHNEGYPDSFKQCFKAFYSYIASKNKSAKPQFATFAEGHHEVVLCEAIFKSHQEGKWVVV